MKNIRDFDTFRWPVSASRSIIASPPVIWTTISRPGNLEDCHPFCKKNTVVKWAGKDSIDIIEYYSGWVMQREFVNWVEGEGYDLYIGREGGRKSFVSWRIKGEQGGSRLSITILPHALQKVPVVVRWIPHFLVIQPSLKSYLESVLKGIDWFITTEKPVIKDQFGTHRWFSIDDS